MAGHPFFFEVRNEFYKDAQGNNFVTVSLDASFLALIKKLVSENSVASLLSYKLQFIECRFYDKTCN